MKTMDLTIKVKVSIDKNSTKEGGYICPENWQTHVIDCLDIDIDPFHNFSNADLEIKEIIIDEVSQDDEKL
jgi:hypothetical protein